MNDLLIKQSRLAPAGVSTKPNSSSLLYFSIFMGIGGDPKDYTKYVLDAGRKAYNVGSHDPVPTKVARLRKEFGKYIVRERSMLKGIYEQD